MSGYSASAAPPTIRKPTTENTRLLQVGRFSRATSSEGPKMARVSLDSTATAKKTPAPMWCHRALRGESTR